MADPTDVTGSRHAADMHAGHDPEVVASLLDGDLVGADRAAAARQVAGCSACAALHRDLLVLASATRELPTPTRTLDFRLTAADVERLREPVAPTARLTGDMHSTSAHASHDTMLVASLADHSLAASEREAAEALVAACGLCAALHADLVALSAATRAMPTPTRPRDYTLTPNDAARLRPSGWRRWVAAFGTSRDVFSRPLAVGLTTLGLAGLLVAGIPSIMPGQGATALPAAADPVGDTTNGPADITGAGAEVGTGAPEPGAAAASAPAVAGSPPADYAAPVEGSPGFVPIGSGRTSVQADGESPAPVQGGTTSGNTTSGKSGSSRGDGASPGQANDSSETAEPGVAANPTGVSLMILVSGALLIVGLGLFAIRWASRRFGD